MIKLPWGMIAGGVGILALILTVVIQGLVLKSTKAELALAIEKENRWAAEQIKCEENVTKLDDALADVAEKAKEVELLTARLQGSTDATHDEAVRRAEAEVERDTIAARYRNLSTRAVDMDVCQTYELAWSALAGGSP